VEPDDEWRDPTVDALTDIRHAAEHIEAVARDLCAVTEAASERTSRHEDAILSELRSVKQALYILIGVTCFVAVSMYR
jgi:hypothetical protein